MTTTRDRPRTVNHNVKNASARARRAALDVSLDDLWSMYGVNEILGSWTKAKKALARARGRWRSEPARMRLIAQNQRVLSKHHGRPLGE